MQNEIEILEKEVRLQKMEAHASELKLNKLKLLQRADKMDSEIATAAEQINELKSEIEALKKGDE